MLETSGSAVFCYRLKLQRIATFIRQVFAAKITFRPRAVCYLAAEFRPNGSKPLRGERGTQGSVLRAEGETPG